MLFEGMALSKPVPNSIKTAQHSLLVFAEQLFLSIVLVWLSRRNIKARFEAGQ
jgi:hypothetical protein